MAKKKAFKYVSDDSESTYRAFNKKGEVIAVETCLATLFQTIKNLDEKAVRYEEMKSYTVSNGWKSMGKPKKNEADTIRLLGFSNRRRSGYISRRDYSRY